MKQIKDIQIGNKVEVPFEDGTNTFDGKPIPKHIATVEHIFISGAIAVRGQYGLCMYMKHEISTVK